MSDGLIGYTGFVGSNLFRQRSFDEGYNSINISSIAGQSFDLLVCAGAPAEKWKANREPERDRRNLRCLMDHLQTVETKQFVLISTIDVFPSPVGVDEESPISPDAQHPYGRHRLELEQFAIGRFPTIVVRLPGLFGRGLKKNIIFDLLHNNGLDKIHADSVFQFYSVDRLWSDIQRCLYEGLRLVHLATEPVSVAEVAETAFGRTFANRPASGQPALYDFRTRYADLLGGADGYLRSRQEVLRDLRRFVEGQREKVA